MTWIDNPPELPRVPREWDAPRKTRGRLGVVVLVIGTILSTLFSIWSFGPDTEQLTCVRRADRCRWIERRNYQFDFGLPKGARVERGPDGEDGARSEEWRAVIETFGQPIRTTEVPEKKEAEAFAAEVNAFVAGDAPELEAILTIPGQREAPLVVFGLGMLLLVVWVAENVRGSLRDLFGSAPID